MTTVETGVLIIGAGPIGLELAVALKKDQIPYCQVERGSIGATIGWYPPETVFFSSPERIAIAGVPLGNQQQRKTSKEEYLTYLRNIANQFELDIKTFTEVYNISRLPDGRFKSFLRNTLTQKELATVISEKVILAIGDMHSPKMLEIEGEELSHVSHYLEDPHQYYGKEVVIVGGKNSAVEASIRLFRAGAKVTLAYRGAELDQDRIKYWLYPELTFLIKKGMISFISSAIPTKITEHKVQFDCKGKLKEISADFVLLMTGYKQDPTLFQQLGVQLEGEGKKPLFSKKTMMTNVDGVYVAGTGSAGTQSSGVKEFIETSHIHVDRILASIKGDPPPVQEKTEPLDNLEN